MKTSSRLKTMATVAVTAALTTVVGSAAGSNPVALYARPPELVGAPWFNTPDEKPITLASRKGKVTILHFWTFK